jgi:hypothetical protein
MHLLLEVEPGLTPIAAIPSPAYDMFLICEEVVWDPDLDMLEEMLAVVDAQLESVQRDSENTSEADQLGYFDRAEHVTGLGFVACQAYLTATYGFLKLKKLGALSVGPRHASGQPIAEIINHAANFWKHHEEWQLDKSQGQQDRIRQAFATVGFPADLDYPLSGILAELTAPQAAAFKPLVSRLEAWREEVRADAT